MRFYPDKNSDFYKNGELIRFGVMKEDFMKKVKGKYDNILPDKILEIKSKNLIEEKNKLLLESNKLNEELKQLNEIQTINKTISKSYYYKFSLLKYPAKGSLARSSAQFLGVNGFIFETSQKQTLNTRVNQQCKAADTLLKQLGML